MIRIGTDCSGIEAPIQALTQMGIPINHVFSCEKDKYAVKSIKANYSPKKIYSDITRRNHLLLPDIDIYVCGFPCQPFSLIGKKNGSSDSRSNILRHCITVIKNKLPKVFVLENVKNFKFTEKGKPFDRLLEELSSIKLYNVYYDVLNTKDYGIPQNRERLFIIGILKNIQKSPFIRPNNLKLENLDKFLVKKISDVKPNSNCIRIVEKYKLDLSKNYVVACAGFGNYMVNMSPTITCNTVYYLTKYNRYMYAKESLALQGFKNFTQVVSDSQIYKQSGNSMSVNVLKEIFKEIFRVTSLFVK